MDARRQMLADDHLERIPSMPIGREASTTSTPTNAHKLQEPALVISSLSHLTFTGCAEIRAGYVLVTNSVTIPGRLSATMSPTDSDRRRKGAERERRRCSPTQRPILGSPRALERAGPGRGWPVAGRGERTPPEPRDHRHHPPGRGAAGGRARAVHPVVSTGPARSPGTLWGRVRKDGTAWIDRVPGCVHGHDAGRGLGKLRVPRPGAGRRVARNDRRHQPCTCQRWPSTRWPSSGSWPASSCSARPWPRARRSLAPRVFWSPWGPQSNCWDSRWASSSHRRYGPLASLGAWLWASVLAGLAINYGSADVLTCDRPRRQPPIASMHLDRPDELGRCELRHQRGDTMAIARRSLARRRAGASRRGPRQATLAC